MSRPNLSENELQAAQELMQQMNMGNFENHLNANGDIDEPEDLQEMRRKYNQNRNEQDRKTQERIRRLEAKIQQLEIENKTSVS